MSSLFAKIDNLLSSNKGDYWGERIASELMYAHRVSLYDSNKWNDLIRNTVDFVSTHKIDEQTCSHAEKMLEPMGSKLKSYTLHCCSHSNMDLNFLWGYDETVSIVLATFQTMLNLLDEYPLFIYSQSQAAAYEIAEKYAPQMIRKIKDYVKQGRWEVTASTWVEADKNMPNGESFAQQVFYAKQYLSNLLEISPDSIRVDFEPDTFGHNRNMPQILKNAGVEYYYFCRGEGNQNHIFNWQSESGEQVIAYKEPHWYDSRIQNDIVFTVPEFCHNNHVTTMMKVYGVGDHGGGPTKRDIERLLDMAQWPLYPVIKFGTYHGYFDAIREFKEEFPIVKNELHSIFTGCLTSQSELKQANRKAETLLSQAEVLSTFSEGFLHKNSNRFLLDEAWKKTLFNQFHDILTGSCVPQVKYFALGKAQEAFACANSVRGESLTQIANQIDTSAYLFECTENDEFFSVGAGAGVFVQNSFHTGLAEKGCGRTRIFHLFNTTEFERCEVCEVVLWDWNGDVEKIRIHDTNGTSVDYQLVKNGFSEEWGHYYLKILVYTSIPAFGYTTLILTETDEYELEDTDRMMTDYLLVKQNLPPCEEYSDFVLENEKIKVVVDCKSFTIKQFYDKQTHTEYCKQPMGIFSVIEEDPYNGGGNAWLVGRYASRQEINQFRLLNVNIGKFLIYQSIEFEASFCNSKIKIVLSLNKNTRHIDYSVECDWHEFSAENQTVKQLSFALPIGYDCDCYRFDIPFSTLERSEKDQDVCGNSFAVANNQELTGNVMVTSDCKYGYRCYDNAIHMNLLRGSYLPDACPEQGLHQMHFSVCVTDSNQIKDAFYQSIHIKHPVVSMSSAPKLGTLPCEYRFLQVESENVVVSSLKLSQTTQNTMLLRMYEVSSKHTDVKITCKHAVKRAYRVDFNEKLLNDSGITVQQNTVEVSMSANSLATIAIEFAE